MSHRQKQVESVLENAVKEVFARGIQDPRLKGALLTVLGVDVTQDYREATVRVSVLPEEKENLAIAAIRHAGMHIRHEVSERVALRRMPAMRFEIDKSLKQQAGVFEALAKVREEREGQAHSGGIADDALGEGGDGGTDAGDAS